MAEEEMFSYDPNEDMFDGKKEKTEWIGNLKSGESMSVRFLKELPLWSKAYKHDFVKVDKNGKIITEDRKTNKEAGEKSIGSIVCISTRKNNDAGIFCPMCEAGLKPKATFGVPVLDRATNSVKFFESSKRTIYYQLQKEFQDNGTITDVDFKISRTGSKMDTKYTATGIRKTASQLTKEEQEMAKQIKVERYFQPKTREQILETLKGKKSDGTDDIPGSSTIDTEEEEKAVQF